MKLVILNKHSQDKGKQFESLVTFLFEKNGFSDVSSKVKSNHEIDVEAIKKDGSSEIREVIECKAYDKPIDMDDWLKFIGKVYVERQSNQGINIQGKLYALSGANRFVAGNFESLSKHDSSIKLITGIALLQEIQTIFPIGDIVRLRSYLTQYSTLLYNSISLAYYNRCFFWIVTFEDNYTVLDHNFKFVSDTQILQMVSNEVAGQHFDIQAEHQASLEKLKQEKIILGIFFLNDGVIDLKVLAQKIQEWAHQEGEDTSNFQIDEALESLASKGALYIDSNNKALLGSLKASSKSFLNTYRAFLDQMIVLNFIGCLYYDENINAELIDEICALQADLKLNDEERQIVTKLVKLSPSALSTAIHPIDFITVSKLDPEHNFIYNDPAQAEILEQSRTKSFLSILYSRFQNDFETSFFSEYFYNIRAIRSIDIQNIVGVYSEDANPVFSLDLSKKMARFRGHESIGGGFPLIIMLDKKNIQTSPGNTAQIDEPGHA